MVSIIGLSSSFPENKVSQKEITKFGKSIFSKFGKDFDKMVSVYANSGVETRYIVNELEWYSREHSWKERNLLFKKNAINLLKDSIAKTFYKTKKKPNDIGAIVVVNSTGILTPSLDVELINQFDFDNNIKKLPIFGYGCAGGVLGLTRGLEIKRSIKKSVLVCNVELCSLTFRPQIFSKSNIVSTALFGDGAASYILDDIGNCEVIDCYEYLWKGTTHFMGWNVENDGLGVVFDKVIPEFIFNRLPDILKEYPPDCNSGYILHSGGMKIIQSYEKILNNCKYIKFSRDVLANFGNISSVSVILVLKKIIEENKKGNFYMIALGPGFTAGMSKLRIN